MKKNILENILFIEGNYIITSDFSIIYFYKLTTPECYTNAMEKLQTLQDNYLKIINSVPILCYLRFYTINNFVDIDIVDFNENILHKYFIDEYKNKVKKEIYQYITIQFNYTLNNNSFDKIKTEIEAIENASFSSFNQLKFASINKLNELEIKTFINQYLFNCNENSIKNNTINKYTNLQIEDFTIYTYSIDDIRQLDNKLIALSLNENTGLCNSLADYFNLLNEQIGISVLTVFIENPEIRFANMKKQADMYSSIASITKNKQYEKEGLDLLNIIGELKATNSQDKIVQMNFTYIAYVYNNNFENINRNILSIFNSNEIKIKYPNDETYNSYTYFELCPNNKINALKNRLTPIYSNNCTAFISTISNYKNDKDGIYFCDRFNNPILVDNFDSDNKIIKARNFAILAPTGEGKSFLAQHILSSRIELGDICVVVDIGKSFLKFSEIYKDRSVFIEYDNSKNMGINPFLEEKQKLLDINYLEFLSQFVYTHTDPNNVIDEPNKIFLRNTLIHYINNNIDKNELNVLNYFQYFIENKDIFKDVFEVSYNFIDINYYLLHFTEFLDGQPYNFFYNNKNKIEFNTEGKQLVIFEIENAIANPKILNLMLCLITHTINNNIMKDIYTRGFVLFDEFATTVKFNGVLNQTAFLAQTIRKKKGAFGYVLQSIEQLPDNELTKPMVENTQIFYILRNTKGYDKIIDRITFNNKEITYDLLNSITSNTSKDNNNNNINYTEMLLKIGHTERIVRLILPKFHQLAFATDGQKNEFLMKEYATNENNLIDLIIKYI